MRKVLITLLLGMQLFAYDFVLLNKTEINDQDIIGQVQDMVSKYYYREENLIEFKILNEKTKILKLLEQKDISTKPERDALTEYAQDIEDSNLEEDFSSIFSSEYLLIVKEKKDRDGRNELNVVLKIKKGDTYNDHAIENFIMPKLEDKNMHYINTIANLVLTYIINADKEFLSASDL